MSNLRLGTLAVALTFGGMSAALSAEELDTSVKANAAAGERMNLPQNGLSQSSVQSKWGQPSSTEGPVGEPPISQWHYADFVVYFEGNRVIHSVAKHQR